jgi:tetratricopeptide (TPR) repeat protein
MRLPCRHSWIAALVVVLAATTAFLPVLQAEFVNWDDDKNFLGNPDYRGLGADRLAWMFTTNHYGGYQPLSWVSLGLDYELWGMDPKGYHLTNLIVHALNALLVFAVLHELLRAVDAGPRRRCWAAAAGAILFAVHPLRVESVAWITERRGLLAALFALASILFYLRAHRPERVRPALALLAGSFLLFVASLLSKGIFLTLPLVLVILDVHPLRRVRAGDRPVRRLAGLMLEKLPWILAAAGVGVLARMAQVEGSAVRTFAEHPLGDRCAQAAYAVWFYLAKTAIPTGLCALHPLEQRLDWSNGAFGAALFLTIALSLVLWLRRRRQPSHLAAWLSLLVLLAPVSGLAQSGPQLVAERYSYLPLVPVAALMAGFLLLRPTRTGRSRVLVAATAVLLAVFMVQSIGQSSSWKNSVALWERVVAVHPDCITGLFNLGCALDVRGRADEAATAYRRCLRVAPTHMGALYNLGMLNYRAKRPREALEIWRYAEAFSPATDARLRYSVALASFDLRDDDAVFEWCQRALEADPTYANACSLEAEAHLRLGRRDRAREALRRTLRIDPSNQAARRRLKALE